MKNVKKFIQECSICTEHKQIEELVDYMCIGLERWETFFGKRPDQPLYILGYWPGINEYNHPFQLKEYIESLDRQMQYAALAYSHWELEEKYSSFENPFYGIMMFLKHKGHYTRVEQGVLDIYSSSGEAFGITVNSKRSL